jgi:hypothetical protein
MRKLEGKPPFKFEVANIIKRLKSLPVAVDGAVKISIPFLEVTVKVDDRDKKIAREVVIRLSDRRVLNAFECCDDCIDNALKSLQEIRQILVNKEAELSDKADSTLYVLMDSIRDAIRQFLTFEQSLSGKHKIEHHYFEQCDMYFAGLEILRAHIHRTLIQIAKIADIEIPGISQGMRYDENWQLEDYEVPTLEKSCRYHP